MKTFHQFLDMYPVLPEMEKILLGTIHPHEHSKFRVPFFYGNRNSVWSILAQAFPESLSQEPTLTEILSFLEQNKIAVSDTVKECRRKQPDALDSNLIDIKFNQKLIGEIQESKIKEIFFTSGLGKNNAAKLFLEELLLQGRISKKLKTSITKDLKTLRESWLPETTFGRAIKLTLLFSPSGSANVGISKSMLFIKNRHIYLNHPTPVSAFKVAYYKEKFT